MDFNLIATATFGLEKVVANELKALGYDELTVENSRVKFSGDEMDVAIANIHLRCADRVLINMGEFKATSFEELYQGVLAIEWGDIIPRNGFMHVNGKSVKSALHSVPDVQSVTKKAIIEAMKRKYPDSQFPEDGPVYKIETAILKDEVTMTIDTSGNGLHKRGYRKDSGAAPLKETLAAAIVLLSGWKGQESVMDVFCGSGTILIEGAMIARDIAPGLNRSFAAETWPNFIEEGVFDDVREGAKGKIKPNNRIFMYGYDKDSWVVKTAKANAEKAGVYENIMFKVRNIEDFSTEFKDAYIMTNPPYGERLEEIDEVKRLMKILGGIRKSNPGFDFSVFTAFKDFEKFYGEKAFKNRKLYNGRLLCYLYQYKGIKTEN